MKKTLITLALVGTAVAAFAQGKITVATDVGTSLVTLDSTRVLPGDSALKGLPVPTSGPLSGGRVLNFGLYAGTASTALSLQTIIPLNPAGGTGQQDGSIAPTHAVLGWTGLTFMQVRVWDAAFPTFEAEVAAGGAIGINTDYLGQGALFSMTPGTSIAYPNIYNGGGTTWQAAPIMVIANVPEPGTFALAGLATAGLLIFRRRK